jgi:AraC family transcriptional regulator
MTLGDFVIMHGGPQAMRLIEHDHKEIQIEAHFSKSALRQQSRSVQPGSFRLISSQKPHLGEWKEGTEVIVLLLDPRHLENAGDELLQRTKFELPEEVWGSDSVVQSIASIVRGEFLAGTNDAMFLEAIRTTISGHLVREYRGGNVRRMDGGLTPSALRNSLEMMEEHLATGVSVEALARLCHVGVHRYNQLFKQSTGFTPYQYFLRLRIERAKQLLVDKSLTLAEIAYSLGFASQGHFTTAFRAHTQLTPRLFIRMMR